MSGKTFRRAVRSADAKIWFKVDADDGSLIHFNCNDSVPGGIVLAFAGETTPDEGLSEEEVLKRQGTSSIAAVKNLFRHAIVKAQQDLFWSMVNGVEGAPGVIDMAQLIAIGNELAGDYSERPTGDSSEPGQPRTSTGSPSTDGRSPAVVTYSRSTPVDA